MRIALLVTCVVDSIAPEVGRSTVRILEHLGHEVVFPADQTCCGQMHANSGYRTEALALARRTIELFEGFDAVVAPSSSCVGMVREVYTELAREAGDAALESRARELGARTYELAELLVRRLGVTDVGASFPHTVAYHPTCHSLRVTRVGDAPRQLLENVRGLQLVELADAEECCGFGGTFAVKNAETSSAILEDKCAALRASGAEFCTALDSSCLLQIGGGLARAGDATRPVHLAEILACREAVA
jgi:L-lactate dehydrogenase complex protein LldE